jgi:hypothetical protein
MTRFGSGGGFTFLIAPETAHSAATDASAIPSTMSWRLRPEMLGGTWR